MSWDPDSDMPLPAGLDSLSPIGLAVAVVVPLLLLSRLFPQFA